jgi:tRNA(Ile)-lysidine synthase
MLSLETFKQVWKEQFPATTIANNHFMIAVSGGLDSIVLAYLMHHAGASCSIAHANFQLRGAESTRDEQFVRSFASSLHIPIFVHAFETAQYAETYKMGIQEAAREIRYAWFDTLLQQVSAEKGKAAFLLTAHHADDQVETVLMQLFRGTGLHGLTGIPARREDIIKMMRPLLTFSKAQIKNFALKNQIDHIEDSSNFSNDYTRNLIRNQLIPQIESVYPQVTTNILDTIERLKEAEQIVNNTIQAFWEKAKHFSKGILSIPIDAWNTIKSNHTYTWELIKDYGFKPNQIEEVLKLLNASQGAYIASPTYRFIKWKAQIQIVPTTSVLAHEVILKAPFQLETEWEILTFELKSIAEVTIQAASGYAYLDAAHIQWPLLYRTWQSSDYFYPLGLRKKKKLGPFLGSLKLNPSLKARATVLTMAEKILWVVGHRIDDRFKIGPSTQQVLLISSQNKP